MSYIIGNWKSNLDEAGVRGWVEKWSELVGKNKNWTNKRGVAVLAPPAIFLSLLKLEIERLGLDLELGIQDISPWDMGAHTGQIAGASLAGLGVGYAILGHSETRSENYQTDELIAQKVHQALNSNLRPILCLDEPYIESQALLIPDNEKSRCIIAFEPISAIGTGQAMTPMTVSPIIKKIKTIFGETTPVLYGGSVNPNNVSEYLSISNGVLVGGASLEAEKFYQLVYNTI